MRPAREGPQWLQDVVLPAANVLMASCFTAGVVWLGLRAAGGLSGSRPGRLGWALGTGAAGWAALSVYWVQQFDEEEPAIGAQAVTGPVRMVTPAAPRREDMLDLD